jgi:hypothetical protein
MSTKLGTALQYTKKAIDLLTPDSQSEKLIFRRFSGDDLQKAVINQGTIPASKIQKVVLKVNPQNIQFGKQKVIQKVQTASPNRFIVFDWGHELTVLTIEGATGNLLPESVIKGGLDPIGNAVMDTLAWAPEAQSNLRQSQSWQTVQQVGSQINALANSALFGNLTYSELLEMSPKYKTFLKLENMYNLADADDDIITLELGEQIFRGFFQEFNFAVTADSPWNWKYTITFVILAEISQAISKSDPTFKDIVSKTDPT